MVAKKKTDLSTRQVQSLRQVAHMVVGGENLDVIRANWESLVIDVVTQEVPIDAIQYALIHKQLPTAEDALSWIV